MFLFFLVFYHETVWMESNKLNWTENWSFQPNILDFLDENFPTRTKFSRSFPTTKNLGGCQLPPLPCYDATASSVSSISTWR